MLISIVLLLTSCPDNNFDCAPKYIFEIPTNLVNVKDTISVGDTIWIEIKFSSLLYDTLSKKMINYQNGDFPFEVVIKQFQFVDKEQDEKLKLANASFKEIILKGSIADNYVNNNCCYYLPDNENGYHLKLGMIATKKGDYFLRIAGLAPYRKDQDECHSISDIFITNGNGLFNNLLDKYHLLNEKESIVGTSIDEFYGFVVVD